MAKQLTSAQQSVYNGFIAAGKANPKVPTAILNNMPAMVPKTTDSTNTVPVFTTGAVPAKSLNQYTADFKTASPTVVNPTLDQVKAFSGTPAANKPTNGILVSQFNKVGAKVNEANAIAANPYVAPTPTDTTPKPTDTTQNTSEPISVSPAASNYTGTTSPYADAYKPYSDAQMLDFAKARGYTEADGILSRAQLENYVANHNPAGGVQTNGGTKPVSGSWADTVNPATVNAATYDASQLGDAAKWNIDSNQTVQGQLDNVLSQDGLIMQNARNQAMQAANDRGLSNSSIAVGAAQDAVIQNAVPIATSDANAYLGANRYNTDTSNQFAVNNFNAQNQQKEFNAQSNNSANQYNATASNHANEFNVSNQFNQASTNFESNVKAALQQMSQDSQKNLQTQQMAGDLYKSYQDQVQNILLNSGSQVTAETKQKLIAQSQDSYKTALSLIDSTNQLGINLERNPSPTAPSLADQQAYTKNLSAFQALASKGKPPTQAAIDAGFAKQASKNAPFAWDKAKLSAAQREQKGQKPTPADIKAGYASSKGEWLI